MLKIREIGVRIVSMTGEIRVLIDVTQALIDAYPEGYRNVMQFASRAVNGSATLMASVKPDQASE